MSGVGRVPSDAYGYYVVCRYCGRQWDMIGGREVGFIVSAAMNHRVACGKRTPEERRAANRRDERRWQKTRLSSGCTIRNRPDHPGLQDGGAS